MTDAVVMGGDGLNLTATVTHRPVRRRTLATSGFDGTDCFKVNPGGVARPFPSLTVRLKRPFQPPTNPVWFRR